MSVYGQKAEGGWVEEGEGGRGNSANWIQEMKLERFGSWMDSGMRDMRATKNLIIWGEGCGEGGGVLVEQEEDLVVVLVVVVEAFVVEEVVKESMSCLTIFFFCSSVSDRMHLLISKQSKTVFQYGLSVCGSMEGFQTSVLE